MNSSNLASGDNSNSPSPRYERGHTDLCNINGRELDNPESSADIITPQMIDEKEVIMKERITQCKSIIGSLKLQLNEEKEKLKNEKKTQLSDSSRGIHNYKAPHAYMNLEDYGNSSIYSASVESKLHCDENLIEYEKQLQKYLNTLNMAQNEKKNAMRKKMLSKAFKLKLMEVENQCNIELLRVKQSLQCLEPLQIIANKWKTDSEDNIYDINNFELMPVFPELHANSGSDINSFRDENYGVKIVTEACENVSKDESALSD